MAISRKRAMVSWPPLPQTPEGTRLGSLSRSRERAGVRVAALLVRVAGETTRLGSLSRSRGGQG